jgi:hypothetical protein
MAIVTGRRVVALGARTPVTRCHYLIDGGVDARGADSAQAQLPLARSSPKSVVQLAQRSRLGQLVASKMAMGSR